MNWRLATAFIKELKIDISPYQTYSELKLCAADWDIEKDVVALLEGTQTDMLLQSVLENNDIELNSEMEEFIANQKNDFLLTRVKLFENFEGNHYVLGKTTCLNRPWINWFIANQNTSIIGILGSIEIRHSKSGIAALIKKHQKLPLVVFGENTVYSNSALIIMRSPTASFYGVPPA